MKIYNTKEAAKALGVHPNTLLSMIKAGTIEHYRTDGGHIRITEDAVEKYQEGKK